MVVAFRRQRLLPLDDCVDALQPSIPHLTRSALQQHGISRLPDIAGDKPGRQKFRRPRDIELAWRRGIRPEPPIPVSDWADRNRILPPTSAEPGRWRTDRKPYLWAVMDALSTSSPMNGSC